MALKPEELEKSQLLQFPAVIGGVFLVVNIPEIPSNALVLMEKQCVRYFLVKLNNGMTQK